MYRNGSLVYVGLIALTTILLYTLFLYSNLKSDLQHTLKGLDALHTQQKDVDDQLSGATNDIDSLQQRLDEETQKVRKWQVESSKERRLKDDQTNKNERLEEDLTQARATVSKTQLELREQRKDSTRQIMECSQQNEHQVQMYNELEEAKTRVASNCSVNQEKNYRERELLKLEKKSLQENIEQLNLQLLNKIPESANRGHGLGHEDDNQAAGVRILGKGDPGNGLDNLQVPHRPTTYYTITRKPLPNPLGGFDQQLVVKRSVNETEVEHVPVVNDSNSSLGKVNEILDFKKTNSKSVLENEGQPGFNQALRGAKPAGQFTVIQGHQGHEVTDPVGAQITSQMDSLYGQAPQDQFPVDQARVDQANQGQAPPGQVPQFQFPVVQAPQGQAPQVQAPVGQASVGQAPQGQAPVGQAPVGQAPQGQAPVGQTPQGLQTFQALPNNNLRPKDFKQPDQSNLQQYNSDKSFHKEENPQNPDHSGIVAQAANVDGQVPVANAPAGIYPAADGQVPVANAPAGIYPAAEVYIESGDNKGNDNNDDGGAQEFNSQTTGNYTRVAIPDEKHDNYNNAAERISQNDVLSNFPDESPKDNNEGREPDNARELQHNFKYHEDEDMLPRY